MKKLLLKEIKLTASPLSFVFIAFSLMTLIPNYPILVGAFFICFGLFQTFQKAREANDTLYSAMLPIKKQDVVKAKFIFILAIQLVAFILILAFTLVRMFLLNDKVPYSTQSLMSANLFYLGFVLLIFCSFNLFFVGGFYKTAYKIGIPFVKYAISAFVLVIIGEAVHFIPGLQFFNYNFHIAQLIVFLVCTILYVIGTLLSFKISKRNFERIDL